MKFLKNTLAITLFSIALFSCQKEDEPDNQQQACITCNITEDNVETRLEICKDNYSVYEDGVFQGTLQYPAGTSEDLQIIATSYRAAGFTCN